MYIEPNITGERRGSIEVICGCMFSGKTEELIRRIRRVQFANQRFEIFKPAIDTRYHTIDIVSHDEKAISSTPVDNARQILLKADNCDVVAIDEGQFFDDELPVVCDELALRGMRVIIAGLDMDYLANPFGPMPKLMAKAEFVTKLHAICPVCGHIANYSFRKTLHADQLVLGEKEVYEPRCRKCFFQELNRNN
ncbi:MAG TPA: thymidine kinase [Flavitalea sp.]|nr:thymidine kinase [Flavitalea sp.]